MTFLSSASRRTRYSLMETGSLCDLSFRKKSISTCADFRPCSRHDLPAVRMQQLSAVVGRLVAGQEHIRRSDVGGRAEATKRQAGSVRPLCFLRQRVKARIDQTGRYAVYQDAVGRELLRERAHEHDQAG